MSNGSSSSPSVFEFLSLHLYLQAFYQDRKRKNHKFTYELWIEELQLTIDKSFLRKVIIGQKKAPQKLVQAIAQKYLTSPKEVEYLECLVKYTESDSQHEKQVYSQRMIQILKGTTPQQLHEVMPDVMSNVLNLRLLTLLSFEDMRCTPSSMALLMDVSEEQIQRSLQILQHHELVCSFSEAGRTFWHAQSKNNRVKENKGSADLMKFHEQSLMDAIKAFSKPKTERKYKSLILPMNEEELAQFFVKMDDFSSEQFARLSSRELAGKRLFQINLNVYPVSQVAPELKASFDASIST